MTWDWVLGIVGVTGIFLVGRKTIWGWLVLLLNECLWIAYAVITDQYGFMVMAIAYGIIYIKSYFGWRREDRISRPIKRLYKKNESYNDNLSDIYYNKPFDEDKYKILTEL
jgi:nicotinamide riboside transporter PnuC